MIKQLLVSAILLCLVLNSNAQTRDKVAGDKYIRTIGSACKTFSDGGCLITTFETMSFSPDSVYINRYTKAECDSKKILNKRYEGSIIIGTYSYHTQKKKNRKNLIIRIDGYETSSFELCENQLKEFINVSNPSINNSEKIIFYLVE